MDVSVAVAAKRRLLTDPTPVMDAEGVGGKCCIGRKPRREENLVHSEGFRVYKYARIKAGNHSWSARANACGPWGRFPRPEIAAEGILRPAN